MSATTELLQACRTRIDDELSAAVPPGAPVALVNFPHHANAGDDAIWLGAEAALARLDRRVRYRASWASYRPDALRRAAPMGPILLNGGGNLGDVYRRQQEVRERVLADFPGRPVVQLPQSIWYRDPGWPEAFASRVEAHGALTLLLRDQASLDRAAGLGAQATELCPDLALGLAPRARPRPPVVDIVWCPQHATESSFDPPDAPDVEVLDWLGRFPDEHPPPVAARLGGLGAHATARAPRLSARAPGLAALSYRALGEHYVARAMRALARGRVVVTERLHGHIFCLLLGLPHVLLDSVNGKVRALAGTWTAASDLVHVADDVEGALELARRLVREAGSAP